MLQAQVDPPEEAEAHQEAKVQPQSVGPVALWDGEASHFSQEHDVTYDEP